MLKLSTDKIIEKIRHFECFEAVNDQYTFTIKIEDYKPFICAAIHNGHQFRKELWSNCTHTEYERWYEEDPCTKDVIQNMPIVISGLDSRFEYDLNRSPEAAIFDTAWGKKLWQKPLTNKEKEISLNKHHQFYKVVYAIVEAINQKHNYCLVFDIHSYNWKRWDREVPTFNLGTKNLNNLEFGDCIEIWRTYLSTINLPKPIKSTAKINDTFFGNGYFLKFITENFKNTLVLATEIKKVYCDELSNLIYPEVVSALKNHFEIIIPKFAAEFSKKYQ
ncbi:MAG: N-formylglutamate amidohydrolase [Lutibacter sp.]